MTIDRDKLAETMASAIPGEPYYCRRCGMMVVRQGDRLEVAIAIDAVCTEPLERISRDEATAIFRKGLK